MTNLSPGTIRGLQACAAAEGVFTILAVDHRDSLRAIIAPEAPGGVVADETLTDVKLAIVQHAAPAASAVVLDPVFSAGQAVVRGHLPGHVGLLCAIEEQGYVGDVYSRRTQIITGWSVEKAKRLGANGIKLLPYYHPDAGEASEAQERLVRSIAADCRRYEIPLFLEPIAYSIDPAFPKGSSQFASVRRRIVVETVRRLSAMGPDIMKVEFPIDAHYETDQALWAEACAELNEVSPVPWALLSAGVPFETFKKQLQVACRAGCSGFVAGRAIWQEAARLPEDERANFLSTTARQRLTELNQIALELGVPWSKRYSETRVDQGWFSQY
jgi:tagatose 1,6-diphosphate aldolase